MEEVKFILGVDWGTSKIGLATADSQNKLAMPLKVVKTLTEVLSVIRSEQIDIVVVGKPIHMNGGDNKLTAGFASFIARLAMESGLTVQFADERLTSLAAQKLSGYSKQAAKEDAIAAMLILQTWLDS